MITHSLHDNKNDTYKVTVKYDGLVVATIDTVDCLVVGEILQLARDMYNYGYEKGKSNNVR